MRRRGTSAVWCNAAIPGWFGYCAAHGCTVSWLRSTAASIDALPVSVLDIRPLTWQLCAGCSTWMMLAGWTQIQRMTRQWTPGCAGTMWSLSITARNTTFCGLGPCSGTRCPGAFAYMLSSPECAPSTGFMHTRCCARRTSRLIKLGRQGVSTLSMCTQWAVTAGARS